MTSFGLLVVVSGLLGLSFSSFNIFKKSNLFSNSKSLFLIISECPPLLRAMHVSPQLTASIKEFEQGSFSLAVMKILDFLNSLASSFESSTPRFFMFLKSALGSPAK